MGKEAVVQSHRESLRHASCLASPLKALAGLVCMTKQLLLLCQRILACLPLRDSICPIIGRPPALTFPLVL